jgi:hypothetical protein
LLLGSSLGGDHLKARSDQKVLFGLRLHAAAANCQSQKRDSADKIKSRE